MRMVGTLIKEEVGLSEDKGSWKLKIQTTRGAHHGNDGAFAGRGRSGPPLTNAVTRSRLPLLEVRISIEERTGLRSPRSSAQLCVF
mmetsp:Transcript_12258/g.33823  ORF Transcript_12258/g.33823 Transcript_12258/m.33823 type:complete len:86 (-) Transcript_12258:484-741(-)